MLVQKTLDQCVQFTRTTTRYVMGPNSRYVPVAIGVPAMAYDGVTGLARGYSAQPARANSIWPSRISIATTYYNVTEVPSMFSDGIQKAYRYKHVAVGVPPMSPDAGAALASTATPSTSPYCASMIIEIVPGVTPSSAIDLNFYQTSPSSQIWTGVRFVPNTQAITLNGPGANNRSYGAYKIANVGPNGGEVWRLYVSVIQQANQTLMVYPYVSGTPMDEEIIVHHCSMEVGAIVPSPPIVTTTAQVSRGLDGMLQTDLSKLAYNAAESTVLCDFTQPRFPHTTLTAWEFGDNTLQNRFYLGQLTSGAVVLGGTYGGASLVTVGVPNTGVIQPGTRVQTAVSVKGTAAKLAVNGTVYSVTTAGIPPCSRLGIGGINTNASNSLGGDIALFEYIPQFKSDAELIAYTTKP